jgi:hypothetical protein
VRAQKYSVDGSSMFLQTLVTIYQNTSEDNIHHNENIKSHETLTIMETMVWNPQTAYCRTVFLVRVD